MVSQKVERPCNGGDEGGTEGGRWYRGAERGHSSTVSQRVEAPEQEGGGTDKG